MSPLRATVSHPNISRPPIVSEGAITLKGSEFEHLATIFFRNVRNDIQDEDKVSCISHACSAAFMTPFSETGSHVASNQGIEAP